MYRQGIALRERRQEVGGTRILPVPLRLSHYIALAQGGVASSQHRGELRLDYTVLYKPRPPRRRRAKTLAQRIKSTSGHCNVTRSLLIISRLGTT
jgi:hypothetical protein